MGRLTGMLAAIYSFSQFTTCYVWSILSNHYGRKPVIIIGNAFSTVRE